MDTVRALDGLRDDRAIFLFVVLDRDRESMTNGI
jgi:hypothetical protein